MKAAILITSVAAAALGLSACQQREPRPTATPVKLDCPERQGELIRQAVAPDGKSCAYRSDQGVEVELRLIPVVGDARQTLAGIEDELRKDRPVAASTPLEPAANVEGAAKEAAAIAAQANQDAGASAPEQAAATEGEEPERAADHHVSADDENVEVDLPGLHVRTEGDNAKVKVGPINIDADENGGAEIDYFREVRLRGEALSREKRGVRAMFVLAGDDNVSSGYRAVGYEARGPRVGPLTVAIVRAPAGADDDFDDFQHDVRRLVRRNSR